MSAGVGVDLENLWIRFGDFVAVRDANVNIKGGDFFSFLGPSGCGKTTILRAVSGFLEPSEGNILIGGKNMKGVGPNKRPTALIFQNLALFPLMKVWENIAFSMEIKGASAGERRKRADELLEMIALEGQGDKLPSELSGGQRQRVAIARALCAEPHVLLLDEPSTGLDPVARLDLWHQLDEVRSTEDVAVLMTTHILDEAERCDRVTILDAGSVVAAGTPASLKGQVGGEVIRIDSDQPQAIMERISQEMNLTADVVGRTVRIESPEGAGLIPKLAEVLSDHVQTITLGHPTLEDVFIHQTGRSFNREREE